MRQLFTSIPSNSTAHEPHSPSPHPSFAPVNPSSLRKRSNNLSMGCASTFIALPLTVKCTSHFAFDSGEEFMASLAPRRQCRSQLTAKRQTNLPAAGESNGTIRRQHLPRRLQWPERVHPWATLRCPWRHARRECCHAPQKIRESAADQRKSA